MLSINKNTQTLIKVPDRVIYFSPVAGSVWTRSLLATKLFEIPRIYHL